ncbi:MAG TPA: ABC transporter permease [Aestuariivirgaceae bacterium]|nr:ABC transporter permease [Aestuariivirgaceae bacterium]
MDSWRENRLVFWVLALPGTFWLTVFFLIPLGLIWLMSFGEKTSLIDIEITGTLDNYVRTTEWVYLQILWKSVWVSALATALCLVVAYPVAFAICFSPARWKPLLLLAVILPFWINLLIRTYALIAVFRTQGYLNYTLEWLWWLGHSAFSLVGLGLIFGERFEPLSLLYNNAAVIAGLVYVYMPFMVLPLYATIERLDRSYIEASLDLGASQPRTFFSVTVPLTMPGIVSGVILVFIPCLGAFLTPDLLGGANAVMIGNVIERQFKAANDWPFGAALSFLLMYATFGILALRSVLTSRRGGGLGI